MTQDVHYTIIGKNAQSQNKNEGKQGALYGNFTKA